MKTSGLVEDYLSTLNPQQRNAVFEDSWDPIRVLAGPGSGKTRVLVARLLFLLHHKNLKPNEVLGFTFTNKAAREMTHRVRSVSDQELPGLFLGTFHSFGASFLRQYGYLENISPYFSIWDESDVMSILRGLLGSLGEGKEERYSPRLLASKILHGKDHSYTEPDEWNRLLPQMPRFFEFVQRYEEEKRKHRAFDFADLIIEPIRFLQTYPELKKKIHQRYRALLVDEYQDTNLSQFILLKELYHPGLSFMVVGDDDQCIYGFRGARSENILQFDKVFPQTKTFILETNYRSNSAIVHLSSELIAQNQQRVPKNLKAEKRGENKVLLYCFENQESEARYLAREVLEERLKNLAVLYRTNAQSLAFEKAFRELKVPYRMFGSLRFYDREEIKDALSYLRLLINPYDRGALLRILNKPRRGVGAKTLQELQKLWDEEDRPLADLCLEYAQRGSRPKKGLQSLAELLLRFSKKLEEGTMKDSKDFLLDFINDFFSQIGLWEYYKEKDQRDFTEKLANVEELLNTVPQVKVNSENLHLFLEDSSLGALPSSGEDQQSQDEASMVSLLTVHSAKGLEFDTVWISGFEQGLFPLKSSEESTQLSSLREEEEERRLLYVALTRAKERLMLCANKQRLHRGRLYWTQISLYFHDFPETSIQHMGPLSLSTEERNISFRPGDRVFHDDYGAGVVTKAWLSSNNELVLKVYFDIGFAQNLLVDYVPLKKVEDKW